MIKGQIIIKLSDGSCISYANKYLAEKEGYDGANPPNLMFPGFSGFSYYYTGFGEDTYEKQDKPGMIAADYKYIADQIDVAGNEYLKFPEAIDGSGPTKVMPESGKEDDEQKDKTAGTNTLVRDTSSTVNSGVTKRRTRVRVDEVVSVNVKEEWVNYPFGRESGYNLPKSSPNFYGFQETKERKAKGADRGPDFNAHLRFDNGFIPRPLIKENYDGTFYVANKEEYNKVVTDFDGNVYGIVNSEYNGQPIIKKSASVYVKGKLVDGPKEKPAEPPKKPEPVPETPEVKAEATKKAPVKKEAPKPVETKIVEPAKVETKTEQKAPEPKIVKQDTKVSMMDKEPETKIEAPTDEKPVEVKSKKTK